MLLFPVCLQAHVVPALLHKYCIIIAASLLLLLLILLLFPVSASNQANAERLHSGLINNLTVASGFFQDELRARQYSKVILMDHVDWLDTHTAKELAETLAQQVSPGGWGDKDE